jgi:hypothetical protein
MKHKVNTNPTTPGQVPEGGQNINAALTAAQAERGKGNYGIAALSYDLAEMAVTGKIISSDPLMRDTLFPPFNGDYTGDEAYAHVAQVVAAQYAAKPEGMQAAVLACNRNGAPEVVGMATEVALYVLTTTVGRNFNRLLLAGKSLISFADNGDQGAIFTFVTTSQEESRQRLPELARLLAPRANQPSVQTNNNKSANPT